MWCASRKINYLETAGTAEKTGTTEKFIIILMILCFAVVSFVSVVSVVSKKPYQARDQISWEKGAECYTRRKRRRWVVLDVRPIVAFFVRGRNRPLITRNLLCWINLKKLHLKLQRLVRADVCTSTILAVCKSRRDPKGDLTTSLYKLHTLSPTLDNTVKWE